MTRSAACLVLVLVAACGAPVAPTPAPPTAGPSAAAPASSAPSPSTAAPSAQASPAASPDAEAARLARWQGAIDAVLPGLEQLHPDPFHGTDRATIEAALATLRDSVPTTTDDELLVGLVRAVSLVSAGGRDAHTGLYPWGAGTTYPLTSLPIRLWLFPDGPHVIEALPPYEGLVGRRLLAIAGTPVDDVMTALDPLVPRDNPTTVRLLLPRFLIVPEVLRGIGMAPDGPLELTFEGDDGPLVQTVEPIPMADYNAWAGPYGLFLPDDNRVLARSRTGEPLFFEDVAPGIVYVGYNAIDGIPTTTLDALEARLAEDGLRGLVVDLRHNTGGERRAIDAPVRVLSAAAEQIPTWVLTGRNTFSGGAIAAARLAAVDGVRVAGEPAGGSPNAFTNTRPLLLGDIGLEAGVATDQSIAIDAADDRLSIEPDLPVEITARDVARGRDPVLDAVLERLR